MSPRHVRRASWPRCSRTGQMPRSSPVRSSWSSDSRRPCCSSKSGPPRPTRELPDPSADALVGSGPMSDDEFAALREDVRLLGSLLGQVVAETGGADLYDDVELL